MSDVISCGEKDGNSEIAAAGLSDDWYMKPYDVSAMEIRRRALFVDWSWKKIAGAAIFGVCLGLSVAALRIPGQSSWAQNAPKSAIPRANSVPASENIPASERVAPPFSAKAKNDEVERLRARNRRLEALVKVLRQRPAEKEKRTLQEQTTYLGQ